MVSVLITGLHVKTNESRTSQNDNFMGINIYKSMRLKPYSGRSPRGEMSSAVCRASISIDL